MSPKQRYVRPAVTILLTSKNDRSSENMCPGTAEQATKSRELALIESAQRDAERLIGSARDRDSDQRQLSRDQRERRNGESPLPNVDAATLPELGKM